MTILDTTLYKGFEIFLVDVMDNTSFFESCQQYFVISLTGYVACSSIECYKCPFESLDCKSHIKKEIYRLFPNYPELAL